MGADTTATHALPSVRSLTERYYVGDPVPKALGPEELRRHLNLAERTFYEYQKAGKFKRFEFRRPVSPTKRYSGKLVKQYLENEAL